MKFKNQQTLSPLTCFIMKVSAMYIIWYFIYDNYLLPDGRLDAFLSLSGVNLAGAFFNIVFRRPFNHGRSGLVRHFI